MSPPRSSSKVAVALAAGGLVPPLLEPLTAGLGLPPGSSPPGGGPSAPILRAKLLEIVRLMYTHSPRPKEFIMTYRIQVGCVVGGGVAGVAGAKRGVRPQQRSPLCAVQ